MGGIHFTAAEREVVRRAYHDAGMYQNKAGLWECRKSDTEIADELAIKYGSIMTEGRCRGVRIEFWGVCKIPPKPEPKFTVVKSEPEPIRPATVVLAPEPPAKPTSQLGQTIMFSLERLQHRMDEILQRQELLLDLWDPKWRDPQSTTE